ncbi:MAG TPA: arsenite efflux transporter metallochaperone ArsD [Bacillota bacterium]|nr:arsenite efflux transporter metallochaperone ArsD [Bacillota bacterium]
MKLEIFDPAMCCPTGICGPSVDQQLVRVASDLETLKRKGIEVARYNLAQDIQAFTLHPTIKELLAKHGPDCLPVIMVNGELKLQGGYPSTMELYQWFGIEGKPKVILPFISVPSQGNEDKNGNGCC